MDVKPGHAMAIRSPSPAEFLIICLWSPWPNAPSSVTATVPQTMPNTVSSVRSFWLRMSRNICRRASLTVSMGNDGSADLLGRPLDDLVPLLQAGHDLGVHPVGDSDLDLGLLRLGLGVAAGKL